ncbi:MAG: hypothetical protein QXK88_02980 [Desulfurococcaceae archaeon]
MGIEYPTLSIMATIVFCIVVFNLLFSYLYVVNEVSRLPNINVHVKAFIETHSNTTKIKLVIQHERGSQTAINYLVLKTDFGDLIVYLPSMSNETIFVTSLGLENGTTILPGSTSYILIESGGRLFTENKDYGGLIFHAKGVAAFRFIAGIS